MPDTIPAIELGKHVGAITCIAKTSSGEWWTTSEDGTLREWQPDGSAGKRVLRFDPASGFFADVKQGIAARHLEKLNSVVEVQPGRLAVAQEGVSAPIRIVDLSSDPPKIMASLLPRDDANAFAVDGAVAVDSSGDVVAADSKGDLCLIDPATAAMTKATPIVPKGISVVTRIAAIPGQRQFVFLARAGDSPTEQTDVWGSATVAAGALKIGSLQPIGDSPRSFAVSATGEVAIGLRQSLAMGEVGRGLRPAPNPFTGGDYAASLAFNPVKKTLVCGSALGEIVQVDGSGKPVGTPVMDPAKSQARSLVCLDDGARVAVGRLDGRFEIVSLDGGAVSPPDADQGGCPPIRSIQWSKAGNVLKWVTYDPRVPEVDFDLQQGLVPDPKSEFGTEDDKAQLGNATLKRVTLNGGAPRLQYSADGRAVFDIPPPYDSLIASPSIVVVAGSNGIQQLDNFGTVKSSYGTSSIASHLALSPDRSLFAAACLDGLVRVYFSDPAKNSGQPIASIFVAPNREWVCWNESSGVYSSSPGGDQLFGFQVGYGPDKAAVFQPFKTLEKADEGGGQGYRQSDWMTKALGGAALGEKEGANQVAANAPQLTLVGVANGTAEANNTYLVPATVDSVNITVSVSGGSDTRVHIRHSVPSAKEFVQADRPDGANRIVVANLSSDKDIFVIDAESPDHVRSNPITLTIHKNTKNQADGKLRILAIGCNHFNDVSQPTLTCCVNDAHSIADLLGQQSTFCQDVASAEAVVKEDPTLAEAKQALQDLINATQPQDRVVIFISSHGFKTDDNRAGILLKDFDGKRPVETGWMWDDIEKQLETSPKSCRSRIILVDTCHSGASAPAVIARLQGEAARGLQDYGTVVVASCEPDEESFEGGKNGLFTAAIVKTLTSNQIDWGSEPNIMTGRMEYWLDLFVNKQLQSDERLKDKHQTPVVYSPLQAPLGAPLARAAAKTGASQSNASQNR